MPRLFTSLALFLILPTAWSARVLPESMIRQMANGYGFVAAEVFQYVVQPERGGIRVYRVTFKIQETYAQPLEGKAFNFRRGKVLILWISVGYGGMCEPADTVGRAFQRGVKYVLPIRYNPEKAIYEHAPGAGGFVPVPRFTSTMRQRVKGVHQIAGQAREERLVTCHRIVAQPSEDIFVRRQVLVEMVALKDSSSVKILKHMWDTQMADQSAAFAMDLDYHSRRLMGEAFEQLPARRGYWLNRFLEPMDELTPQERVQEAMVRNNLLSGLLVEIGRHHPKEVTRRLLPVFRQPVWPEGFRVATLRILLNLHRVLDELPTQWEPALQQVIREMQERVAGPEKAFLDRVLTWAASPPNTWEKRVFKPAGRK